VLAGSEATNSDAAEALAAPAEGCRAGEHATVLPNELDAALGDAFARQRGDSDGGSTDSEDGRYVAGRFEGDSSRGGSSEEESPAIMAELAEWGRGRVHLRVRGVSATVPATSVPVPATTEPDEVFAQHGQLGAWLREADHTSAKQDQRAAQRTAVMDALFDTLWQDLQHPDFAHILPLLTPAPAPEQEWPQEVGSTQELGGAEVMRFSSSDSSQGSCGTGGNPVDEDIFGDADEHAPSQPVSRSEFQEGRLHELAGDYTEYAGNAPAGPMEPVTVADAPLPPLESRQWRHPSSPGGTAISSGRTLSAPSLNMSGGLTGEVLDPTFEFEHLPVGASSTSRGSARSAGGWGQRADGSMRLLHRPLSGGITRGSGQRGHHCPFRHTDGAEDDVGREHGDRDGWSFLPPIVGRGVGRR
jgi:hypothetical protein